MSERTKGRLVLSLNGFSVVADNGGHVTNVVGLGTSDAADEANARHLVACWNAVEDLGLTTEQLESGVLREMVEALRAIRDGDYGNAHDCKAAAKVARDVLAKIGGGS